MGDHSELLVDPVPMTPTAFEQQLRGMKFTSKTTDPDIVVELYKRIWPTITQKNTPLRVEKWGDADVQQFIQVLPALEKLTEIEIWSTTLSAAMEFELSEIMKQRGGTL